MYHNLIRTDFVQQRRKEFAMEGQAWLDLKRFFYRNPQMAEKFLYQMDRGIQFSQNPEIENKSLFETESGYSRRQLVFELNKQLSRDAGEAEPTIFIQSFIEKKYWYLPIPSSAKAYLSSSVIDAADQVLNQSYPY